ncbi:hypothetical protein [Flavobacterium sp. ACAM 123]|jgi:hypothetical protein|uniref:hypothetical protein n=1 Tax=Flavobacterium sp. ACAM 123 TaxID=1189620 RepID=UPI0002E0EF39|nr:hypothetical protein [Flavobacterium sp. ACAM 123]
MDLNKVNDQLQTVLDTTFLYGSRTEIQADENLKRVLRSLSNIENGPATYVI